MNSMIPRIGDKFKCISKTTSRGSIDINFIVVGGIYEVESLPPRTIEECKANGSYALYGYWGKVVKFKGCKSAFWVDGFFEKVEPEPPSLWRRIIL